MTDSLTWPDLTLSFYFRWCSLFNADLALSVTMVSFPLILAQFLITSILANILTSLLAMCPLQTAISTILSVVMLPANLLLYTQFSYEDDVVHNLDWKSLFLALFVVIGAIFIGLYCSYTFKSKKFHKRCNAVSSAE